MLDAKTRDSMSRKDLVSHHLRVLALQVDPRTGLLNRLAEELDVHPVTLSAWIAQGYVPWFQCKKLQKRFGRKLVPLDDLCPEEFRRN
jgi:hypothetical protein